MIPDLLIAWAVALPVAAAAVVVGVVRGARRYRAELTAREAALVGEVEHWVAVRLPAALEAARTPEVPQVVPPARQQVGATGDRLDEALALAAEAVAAARRSGDAGGAAVLRSVTADAQALSYRMQEVLEAAARMCDARPDLHERIVEADRLQELSRALLQRAGIVAGGTPRLVRTDTHLPDIVAGALARIEGAEQVMTISQLRRRLGVAARAAEPVAVVLAELLRNAVAYSPGSLGVRVQLHEVPSGAVVTVDDSGPGMAPDDLTWARRVVAGETRPMLVELGTPPRQGLVAAGLVARGSGLRIDWSANVFGGLQTVLMVPGELLVEMPGSVAMSPASAMPVTPPPTSMAPAEAPAAGLPRRVRRQPAPPRTAGSGIAPPLHDTAAQLGAFQRASAQTDPIDPESTSTEDQ